MRRASIAIALILAAGSAVPAARAGSDDPSAYAERSEQAVATAGVRALDVVNARGRVELSPSTDGRLHIVATKLCRLGDRNEARRLAAETTVETSLHEGVYAVHVHYPRHIESHVNFWDLFTDRGRHGLHLPVLEVRLELQAPPALPATISSTSGDLSASGRAGAVKLHSVSGDLEAAAGRGPLDAETTSGDVTLHDIAMARVRTASGDVAVEDATALDIETTSGDVNVTGARGELALESTSGDLVVLDAPAGISAHTVSGEVDLRGACGRVDAGTQSGDIRARLRSPLSGAKATSVSGGIAVDLVPGLAATIAARSVSGSIDCRVPATVLAHDRNSLDARIGQGGAPVRLESTSGNVSIMSGGK